MPINISVDTDGLKKTSCVQLVDCISDIDIDTGHRNAYSSYLLWAIRKPVEVEVCARLGIEKVKQFPGNLKKEYDGKAIWKMAQQWDKDNPKLPVPVKPNPTPTKPAPKRKVTAKDLAGINGLL